MSSVAVYARVSSEQQAQQATIESQIAAVKERVASDGHVVVPTDIYVDDGYSGSTLRRPALERLRDRVAEGGLDVVYVHSPDRLARRYAYQVLLLEEFSAHQVRVVVLQGRNGESAEDQLLLQVQGVIAEYERAKILERSRRGKMHKARQGMLNPFAQAPYGYLYVKKSPEAPARFQVVLHEAKIVRRIFTSVVREQKSLNRLARELNTEGVPTRGTSKRWTITALRDVLVNPAYMGRAAYGKTESVERAEPLRLRTGRAAAPRHAKSSSRRRAPEDWIYVSVPALVSEDTFRAAGEQMERNRMLAQRNAKQQRYLVSGLTVCAQCSYGYYGKTNKHGGSYSYSYYRCTGCDRGHFPDGPVCHNRPVRADQLDQHVWQSVRELLEDPDRVMQEWARRSASSGRTESLSREREEAMRVTAAHERALKRLVDAFEVGVLDLTELKQRSDRVRTRIEQARKDIAALDATLAQQGELKLVADRLHDFARRVRDSLDRLTWQQRRDIIRAVVRRIEIDQDAATIVYRVPIPDSPPPPSHRAPDRFVDCNGGTSVPITR